MLVELLGIGGFGEVWKAKHAHFDSFEPVALKFCTDREARDRLLKHEAKVCDRVMRQGRHAGIVPLVATYLSADPPCLQYEYVEGGDLGGLILDWHRQAEKPSPEQVATALLQIAEIGAFTHRLNPPIVHRDLKPANILVRRSRTGEMEFKITDFGIGGIAVARAIQDNRQPTSPSQFWPSMMRGSGTTLYASPEQLLPSHDPDPRDDVHALGVIWYQMLTGDLTRGRPGGSGWRRRLLERGMSTAMVELLESCFEDEADRPADAGVLAEKLTVLLKPAAPPDADVVLEDKNETVILPDPDVVLEDKNETIIPPDPIVAESPLPPPRRAIGDAIVERKLDPIVVTSLSPSLQKDVVNTIGTKLKLIPAGEFSMGSTEFYDAKPIRRVTISRPFYLSVYPVTQREYTHLVKKNPSHFSGTERLPVEMVSWFDAIAFCNELSRKEGLRPFYTIKDQAVEVPDWSGPGYRLPTEAEWEYASRAGTTTRFSFGDDEQRLGEHAWYDKNSSGKTHPVGKKKPNPFGLFDMHGNVYEWCWDWYHASHYENKSSHIDSVGPESSDARVLRGGCWNYDAIYARAAGRDGLAPAERDRSSGFRLARTCCLESCFEDEADRSCWFLGLTPREQSLESCFEDEADRSAATELLDEKLGTPINRPGGFEGLSLTVGNEPLVRAPTLQQVHAAVDALATQDGPEFLILEGPGEDFAQAAGGDGVYTAEWREHSSFWRADSVAGLPSRPSGEDIVFSKSDGAEMTVNERLDAADVKVILTAFAERKGRPTRFAWRDISDELA